MKRLLVVLLLVSFTLPQGANAQTDSSDRECSEGVCLSDDRAEEIREILRDYKCLQSSVKNGLGESEDFSLSFKEWQVVVTRDHQVFAKDKLQGTLQWCEWEVAFKAKPDLKAYLAPEDDPGIQWGFRPRVKLAFLLHPVAMFQSSNLSEWSEPAVAFEPFHVGFFHLQVHAGLSSFGLGPGVDLTRNLDLYAGPRIEWTQLNQVRAFVGVSVSLN